MMIVSKFGLIIGMRKQIYVLIKAKLQDIDIIERVLKYNGQNLKIDYIRWRLCSSKSFLIFSSESTR